QRDRTIWLAWMFQTVHRLQHRFQNASDVIVYPGTRLAGDAFDRLSRREIVPTQPDIHRHVHAVRPSWRAYRTPSKPATVVTGRWQVKSRQTYAAARPSTGSIPARAGTGPANARSRLVDPLMVIANGR